MMFYLLRLVVLAIHLSTVAAFVTRQSSPSAACSFFQNSYPSLTSFPGNASYTQQNSDFYNVEAAIGPACIFAPSSAAEMSFAVTNLTSLGVPFAIRGGGHMPIVGAANINSSGVLLSASNLATLQLSSDNSIMSIGPGNTWVNVYDYLEPYGLLVAGGRVGIVGVPGYIIGGGFSFFNSEIGWTANTVDTIECVLANGDIVEATASNEYSDLFWALKGGGNSFCIATRFDLPTMAIPKVMIGDTIYRLDEAQTFLESAYWFAVEGSQDPKAHVIPIMTYSGAIDAATYEAIVFYNGNDPAPAALQNFTAGILDKGMTPVVSTFAYRTMSSWCTEIDAVFTLGIETGKREHFHVVPIYASMEAVQIVHDTYLATVEQITNVSGLLAALAFVPISEGFVQASNANGGSPQGVDPSRAPYLWIEQNISWDNEADDETMINAINSLNQAIDSQLGAQNLKAPFIYLNDADVVQQVFQNYPPDNLARLQSIRAKYDPGRVYTDLMPGGWKVDHV